MSCLFCVFFFKQKTAYEMRISDWSSDVCSSDLVPGQKQLSIVLAGRQEISDTSVLEIDGHFTHRTTARCISPTSAAVSISCYRQGSVVASGVDSWSVSPAFRFSLPSGWNLNILGTYSQSNNTISNLTYAGGVETMPALPNYDNSLDREERRVGKG